MSVLRLKDRYSYLDVCDTLIVLDVLLLTIG